MLAGIAERAAGSSLLLGWNVELIGAGRLDSRNNNARGDYLLSLGSFASGRGLETQAGAVTFTVFSLCCFDCDVSKISVLMCVFRYPEYAIVKNWVFFLYAIESVT